MEKGVPAWFCGPAGPQIQRGEICSAPLRLAFSNWVRSAPIGFC